MDSNSNNNDNNNNNVKCFHFTLSGLANLYR